MAETIAQHRPFLRRWPRARRLRPAWPWIALVAIKLWLVAGQRLTAYGSLTIDDQWFVSRAASISAGHWFGSFDAHTLIKQPGYPLFVAAVHAVRMPLLLAHQLLYVAAVSLMMVALRPILGTRWRRLAVFAVLLFNPMTMNTPISARVDRSGVYPALTVMVLACLVALINSAARPNRATAGWIVASSVALGALWLVREEWLLVLPAVACAMVLAIVLVIRSSSPAVLRAELAVGIALIPISVVIGTALLRHVNESHYGLAITNVEQTSMSAGLGPMFRVEPATTFHQFPVTVETRQLMYAISPHFAALRGQIEAGVGDRYSSVRPDGVRDLGGQVYQWVVLDAIGATGGASSAVELDGTFRAIGHEIDAACDDGRLKCSGPHSGIAPAWQWSLLPDLLRHSLVGLGNTVDLGAFSALSPKGDGSVADRQLFSRMTSEPLSPGPSGFFTRQRVHLIAGFRWLYRVLMVAALGIALVRLGRMWKGRKRPTWTTLAVASVGSLLVGVRVVGLAFLDLTAFPAFSPSYLASAYAVVVVMGTGATLAGSASHEPQPVA
jgi:hypothetical protein